MEFIKTPFDGLYEVHAPRLPDDRGMFRKVFHAPTLDPVTNDFCVKEVYYSVSSYGAVRGLHFQIPPSDHHKLIFCLKGKIFDACVDLRKSAATYGRHRTSEIGQGDNRGMLVPKGFAHGFQALEEGTIVVSMASGVYAPEHERGVAWDSCGIDWPCKEPIVSDKDRRQPPLAGFVSAFP